MSRMQENTDQNQRELSYPNQRDDSARTPLSENEISDEESAAMAAREKAKPRKDLAEVSPDQQHTRIP